MKDIFCPEIIVLTAEKSIFLARLHAHYQDFFQRKLNIRNVDKY